MLGNFTVIHGTIISQGHFQVSKPNQDAFSCEATEDYIVGAVSDGVSGGQYSEIGARLLCDLACEEAKLWISQRGIVNYGQAVNSLGFINRNIQRALWDTCTILSVGRYDTTDLLAKYMQATLILFVITKDLYIIARIGDGLIVINDDTRIFDSGVMNVPDCIAHGLIDPARLKVPVDSNFHLEAFGSTSTIGSLLIGTDGVPKLNNLADITLPNGQSCGTYNQFLTDPRYRKNPVLVQRKLNLMNVNGYRPNDDATFIGLVREA